MLLLLSEAREKPFLCLHPPLLSPVAGVEAPFTTVAGFEVTSDAWSSHPLCVLLAPFCLLAPGAVFATAVASASASESLLVGCRCAASTRHSPSSPDVSNVSDGGMADQRCTIRGLYKARSRSTRVRPICSKPWGRQWGLVELASPFDEWLPF